jgi:hypothetical protein
MQRRAFLKFAALSGLAVGGSSYVLADQTPPTSGFGRVHTVLLVTKCHLDVGFTKTQAKVIRQYFDVYYPAAIKTAAQLRVCGPDHYTWTTGSWLLYEYLEQAGPSQRRAIEEAVAAGDIAWHALPFNWQTEMIDRSMIEGSLGFSQTLDSRFGKTTTGAKMTDVPGHTRGLVAPLAAAGVRLLDIGVNSASTPPDVPEVFLWKEPGGAALAMMYHQHDYGGVIEIPGAGVVVDMEVRGDNSGPHTLAEIAAIYAKLRTQFPGATIKAASMTDVAHAVEPVRDRLPVVTAEIGDTWIYGCSSDPDKVARYREIARLRKSWIAQGILASADATDRKLLQNLLLAPEHTWGTDTKTYLDDAHYRPADLEEVLGESGYSVMERSWKEKRVDIDAAVATLSSELYTQASAQLEGLRALPPSAKGMVVHDPAQPIETKFFTLALDPTTGAIVQLHNKATGLMWATPAHPLALFTYETLSAADYASFLDRYIKTEADWAPKDFGKPGIQNFGAASREWHPGVVRCWTGIGPGEDRLLAELAIDDAAALATGNVAWPKQIFLDLRMPVSEPRVDLQVVTLGKMENRMPEAMWLTFAPANADPKNWRLEKVDQWINPLDVVSGGGRSMHAITESVVCENAPGSRFALRTLDAPVVALGQRTPLNFSLQQPNLSSGLHFSLFNNAWGTNYLQWCGGDWMYRFHLHLA